MSSSVETRVYILIIMEDQQLSTSLLLASLLFGTAAVALFKYLKQYMDLRATLNKIPGPKELFLFGNALSFEREAHGKSKF